MPFEEIYREYYAIVYGFLINLCKNECVSEEITAETFYKAFKSYAKFDGNVKISTWLCQIAKNEYFRYYKKSKRLKNLDEADELCGIQIFEDLISDKDDAIKIHKLLHNLNEPYREVFTLRVLGELSFRDIAIIFDKSETWARVTFYRSKLKILEQMEDRNE